MKKENKSQESIYKNKGGNALYRILRFILPYCIYTKLLFKIDEKIFQLIV